VGAAAGQEHPDSLAGSKAAGLLIGEGNERPGVEPYQQLLGSLRMNRMLEHAGIEGVTVAYCQHFAHAFHRPGAGACA
jgi:hypothetical protein